MGKQIEVKENSDEIEEAELKCLIRSHMRDGKKPWFYVYTRWIQWSDDKQNDAVDLAIITGWSIQVVKREILPILKRYKEMGLDPNEKERAITDLELDLYVQDRISEGLN